MGPRGVGTMISMLIVGRLVRRVDARVLVTVGLILTAASLYLMTGFTPQMTASPIIWSGVLQGLGLGLVFVPLSTVAFSTIDPMFRADATSLFSLVRNIGSSIGISIVSVMLTRNVQVNHGELGAAISAYNPMLWQVSPGAASGNATALSQMDQLVNVQALMIS
jgi:DHA2 family multidrug resistance protein